MYTTTLFISPDPMNSNSTKDTESTWWIYPAALPLWNWWFFFKTSNGVHQCLKPVSWIGNPSIHFREKNKIYEAPGAGNHETAGRLISSYTIFKCLLNHWHGSLHTVKPIERWQLEHIQYCHHTRELKGRRRNRTFIGSYAREIGIHSAKAKFFEKTPQTEILIATVISLLDHWDECLHIIKPIEGWVQIDFNTVITSPFGLERKNRRRNGTLSWITCMWSLEFHSAIVAKMMMNLLGFHGRIMR